MRKVLLALVAVFGACGPAAAQTVTINGPPEPTTIIDPTSGQEVPAVIVNLTVEGLPAGPGTYRLGADWYRYTTDARRRFTLMFNYWGDDWALPANGEPVSFSVTLFSNNPPGIMPLFDGEDYWLEVWAVVDGTEGEHTGAYYTQP